MLPSSSQPRAAPGAKVTAGKWEEEEEEEVLMLVIHSPGLKGFYSF